MQPPWTFMFWAKLNLGSLPEQERWPIIEHEGITIFLTKAESRFGVSVNENVYLGPKALGLEASPWVFYGLTHDGHDTVLVLNGQAVLNVRDTEITYRMDELKLEAGSQKQEVIIEDLQYWVNKRKEMFKTKKETSPNMRLLSLGKQEQQLRDRICAVDDLVTSYKAGRSYFFEDIVANLRSLLYYRKGSQFDPLLLRIAAFRDRALPIYTIGTEEDENVIPKIIEEFKPALWLMGSVVGFEPILPKCRMVDFQSFLEKDAFYCEGQRISVLGLIERVGNKQSTAHFDQTICVAAEKLQNDMPTFLGRRSLESIIVQVAEITVRIGDRMLN